MICFENVSFQYESERHPALREFTHSIAKGELVLLLGPSGCGKTTITRLLNGLVPHFYEGELKGIVRIGGRTTTETTIQSLADIVGSVWQRGINSTRPYFTDYSGGNDGTKEQIRLQRCK